LPRVRSCDLVVRYALEFEKGWQAHERQVGDSWRCDETYLKLKGEWVYLYRAVDQRGKTVESYLSRTRDITAAKAFFRKAFKRYGDPRLITLDGFEPTHAALRRMGMNNELNFRWENSVQIRTCAYLNHVVEQDHWRIRSCVGPMLGFKRFFNARRVVAGVELVQKIVKGQFEVPESFGTDPFDVWRNVLAS
jgi:transposase-like protein